MKLSRITAFSSALLLGALLALTGAASAQAAPSAAATDYVALGDSYSSGLGAGAYDSAHAATASAPPVRTRPSGRPRIHPPRSRSPLARALVRVM